MDWAVVQEWVGHMARGGWGTAADYLHLLLVALGLLFVVAQIRHANVQRYMQMMLQAEKDYEKLHLRILDDADLTADYTALVTRTSLPASPRGSELWKKKFVFWELYYGHLAKVYALIRVGRLNPLRGRRMSKRYWLLYENWLKQLVRHPIFLDVHEAAKLQGTYEADFIKHVDRLIRSR